MLGVSGLPLSACLSTLCLAALSAGTAFLGGLTGPVAGVGLVWIGARLALLQSAWGFETIALITASEKGGPPLSWSRIAAFVLAMPETAIEIHVPPAISILALLAGSALVLVAFIWFEAAEFPGRRSA